MSSAIDCYIAGKFFDRGSWLQIQSFGHQKGGPFLVAVAELKQGGLSCTHLVVDLACRFFVYDGEMKGNSGFHGYLKGPFEYAPVPAPKTGLTIQDLTWDLNGTEVLNVSKMRESEVIEKFGSIIVTRAKECASLLLQRARQASLRSQPPRSPFSL